MVPTFLDVTRPSHRHPTLHEKAPINDKTFEPVHCALTIYSNMHRLINIIFCGLTGTLPVFYLKFNNHGIEGEKKNHVRLVPTHLGEMWKKKMPYFSQGSPSVLETFCYFSFLYKI